MACLVNLTLRALAQLFEDINAVNSETALKWYRGLKEAIPTLREQPNRCAVTPESKRLRHLPYGDKSYIYRVIYRILEKQKRGRSATRSSRCETEVKSDPSHVKRSTRADYPRVRRRVRNWRRVEPCQFQAGRRIHGMPEARLCS